jgi:hypothetical protein
MPSAPCHAAWVDKSDELPGKDDNNGTIITVAIVGAVIVVAFLIYRAKMKSVNNEEKCTELKRQEEIQKSWVGIANTDILSDSELQIDSNSVAAQP